MLYANRIARMVQTWGSSQRRLKFERCVMWCGLMSFPSTDSSTLVARAAAPLYLSLPLLSPPHPYRFQLPRCSRIRHRAWRRCLRQIADVRV